MSAQIGPTTSQSWSAAQSSAETSCESPTRRSLHDATRLAPINTAAQAAPLAPLRRRASAVRASAIGITRVALGLAGVAGLVGHTLAALRSAQGVEAAVADDARWTGVH